VMTETVNSTGMIQRSRRTIYAITIRLV
jgi:hypothetical protein